MSTLQIVLPPLRDRLEDVPLLVDHFVSVFNEREQRRSEGFTPAAIRRLQQHDWPGNVRELEGVVYRSLVMAGTTRKLDADEVDLRPATSTKPPPSRDFARPFAELRAEVLEEFERAYLDATLRRTNGNLSRAAREAVHERKSLWRLLNRYGIDPRQYRARAQRGGTPADPDEAGSD
jgi:DNA-binding NtrC family response regulator